MEVNRTNVIVNCSLVLWAPSCAFPKYLAFACFMLARKIRFLLDLPEGIPSWEEHLGHGSRIAPIMIPLQYNSPSQNPPTLV